MAEHFEVLVIGGGQSGLAAGYHLSKAGLNYVIVDDGARVGDAWRRRWGSLRLFTPARIDGLPGMPFPAPPGSTVTKDQAADYMESYAKRFGLAVRLYVRVRSLKHDGGSFVTDTGITADNVIVATGSYGAPHIPTFASQLDPAITQIHSTQYREPSQLQGDVLVVGAGNSGAEIALDAVGAKHRTWLAGRETGKIPYPVVFSPPFWWLFANVLMTLNTPIGKRVAVAAYTRGQPLVRVKPSELVAAGVVRVPRVAGVQDGKPRLDDARMLDVGTVVWATGFNHAYPWVDLPISDAAGQVRHSRGVVESQPGLYFVGLPFQSSIRSSLIDGVGEDARYVVEKIAATRSRPSP